MTIVPCEACGAVNRVKQPPSGTAPICGKCGRGLHFSGSVVSVASKGLEILIAKSPLPVVVDFWAAWCGPCRVFAPVFERVAEDELPRFVFAKVDTERAPESARAHRIQAIPTLIVFHRGREIRRQAGALGEPALRELLDAVSSEIAARA